MSDEAKKYVDAVEKGVLPPINSQSKNNGLGIETSTRGLNRTTFGLQKDHKKEQHKNDTD